FRYKNYYVTSLLKKPTKMKKHFNKIEPNNQITNQPINIIKETQLSLFCRKTIKYLIMVVFLSIPLWVSTGYSLSLAKSNLFQILVYFLLFFFTIRSLEIKKIEIKLNSINILLLIWFFIMILATIFSPDRQMAFWGNQIRFEGLKFFIFLFIFYFILTSVISKKSINQIIKLLIYSSIIICAYAISQSTGHYIFSVPFEFQIEGGVNRAFATFGNPIMLASYLAVLLPLTYYNFLQVDRSNKIIKYLHLLIICLQLYTIFITYTRGPLIALIVGIGLYLLIKIYSSKIKLLKIISTFLAISLLLIIILVNIFSATLKSDTTNPIISRFTSILDLKKSFSNRIIIWQSLIKPIKNHIWFGFGSDVYDEYSLSKDYFNPKMLTLGGGELRIDKAHNLFIDNLLCFGIFAAITLIILLIKLILLLINKIKSEKNDLNKSYFSLLLTSITIFIIANLSAFPQICDYFLLFFIITLITFGDDTEQNNNSKLINYSGNIYLYLFIGLILIFVYYFLTYTQSKAEKNNNLAQGYLKIAKYQEAEKYAESAYKYNNRLYQYSKNLIGIKLNQKNDSKINEAVKISEDLVKNRPQEIQNWVILAMSYNEEGSKDNQYYVKADEIITQALNRFGCQLELYREKIRQIAVRGNLLNIDSILHDAKKSAFYNGKQYYSNYFILGASEGLIKKEDYMGAINFINNYWDTNVSSSDDNKYWFLGFSYYKLHDIANAESALNLCTNYKKNDLNCYRTLITLFYEQKNWDKVREYIEKTRKIYPQIAEEYSKSLENIIKQTK
ncbi:MAG: hypothetical protein ACD_58C00117G0003, partial [uncultured bacterium]